MRPSFLAEALPRLALAGAAGLGVACSPGTPERHAGDAIEELERLAFVPAAEFQLEPSVLPYADLSLRVPIVIDLFELTRGELDRLYREHAPGRRPRAEQVRWRSEAGIREDVPEWPAFLSFDEAVEVAGWRGMRLPTAREWLHVAVGRRGLRHPWGADQDSVANTVELGVGVPTPVGTFESGRSEPFGCYDMEGNVWEWVSDAVPGFRDTKQDLDETFRAPGLGPSSGRVSALGGAYDTLGEPTYDTIPRQGISSFFFHARRMDRATLAPSVGVRMCADAGAYLRAHAALWGASPRARERVRAVGRRWGEDPAARAALLQLLSELESEADPSEALGWLRAGVEEAGA